MATQAGRGKVVLIGGPPCQAYSLIGRVRNRAKTGYRAEDDGRHFLYQEYLGILSRLWPEVFVMENVKGVLSSEVSGDPMFERITGDLREPARAIRRRDRRGGGKSDHGYRLIPVFGETGDDEPAGGAPTPDAFVVRCELHGVPQRRHRVILIGIRDDVDAGQVVLTRGPAKKTKPPTVMDMIGMLPAVRSRLSTGDSVESWRTAVAGVAERLSGVVGPTKAAVAEVRRVLARMEASPSNTGAEWVTTAKRMAPRHPEPEWFVDDRLHGLPNHAARSHMDEDLHRYLFAACYSENPIKNVIAQCPSGFKVVGGGHLTTAAQNVPRSIATTDEAGWEVRATNMADPATTEPWSVTAMAICVEAID